MEIVELCSEDELRSAYPVMSELRDHLTEDDYMRLLGEMIRGGYRLFALEQGGRIAALAGISIRTNFYYGRYLWVYDLITTSSERSKGYGERLLSFLEEFARAEGCETLALSSGVQRADAHRFYEDKMRYERASYVFKRGLL
ncbi:MAG: GNAT family N-acetyltransferase [Actinomycetota bacterium]